MEILHNINYSIVFVQNLPQCILDTCSPCLIKTPRNIVGTTFLNPEWNVHGPQRSSPYVVSTVDLWFT